MGGSMSILHEFQPVQLREEWGPDLREFRLDLKFQTNVEEGVGIEQTDEEEKKKETEGIEEQIIRVRLTEEHVPSHHRGVSRRLVAKHSPILVVIPVGERDLLRNETLRRVESAKALNRTRSAQEIHQGASLGKGCVLNENTGHPLHEELGDEDAEQEEQQEMPERLLLGEGALEKGLPLPEKVETREQEKDVEQGLTVRGDDEQIDDDQPVDIGIEERSETIRPGQGSIGQEIVQQMRTIRLRWTIEVVSHLLHTRLSLLQEKVLLLQGENDQQEEIW